MATSAFYDGRRAGYSGTPKAANPHSQNATDWDNGFNEGEFFRSSPYADLVRAMNNIDDLVKNGGNGK